MKDQTLICADCQQEFVFTTGEQQFYQEKGVPIPAYCLICRGKKRAQQQDQAKHKKD